MYIFAVPPLADLVEVVVTTAVGTLVALVVKDTYEKMTQSDENQQ